MIPSMRLGITQTLPAFGERDENIGEALALLDGKSADLWVLPEFFATGYQFTSRDEVTDLAEPVPGGPTSERLIEFCRERHCYVVAGVPEASDGLVYNTAILVGPGGFLSCYRKIHLFGDEASYFAPGDRPFSVTDIGQARVGVMICFDHLFPESARSLALQGADVIAHPANLILPDLAQRTMIIRALENGVFTATANRVGEEARSDTTLRYTGQSQIISPDGQVLVRLSPDRQEIAIVEIDPTDARRKRITSRNDKLADRRPHLYRF
jgi:predicted amidohydrolase